ncbi:hypothetical protein TW74_18900 [Vibrio nigripulchritudo]|nr:hypothetical protein TW74_18900 [Vibrio nigripulchritudo]
MTFLGHKNEPKRKQKELIQNTVKIQDTHQIYILRHYILGFLQIGPIFNNHLNAYKMSKF